MSRTVGNVQSCILRVDLSDRHKAPEVERVSALELQLRAVVVMVVCQNPLGLGLRVHLTEYDEYRPRGNDALRIAILVCGLSVG